MPNELLLDWDHICTNKPHDWELQHFGSLFREREERGEEQLPLLSVTRTGLHLQEETNRRDTSNKDKSKYKVIRVGDIVYNTMRMWQGRSALVAMEGLVSPAYTVLEPNKTVDSKFAGYLLKLPSLVRKFRAYSQGLVSDTWSLKFEPFSKLSTLLPPLAEQRKIVEILSSVDEAIATTEAVIEQTRKVKDGLLQELLTKGIGHTRFKQTKIGEMPESWEVKRLGDVVESLDQQRVPIKASDRKKRQGHIPYYGASGVIDWVDDSLFDEPILLISEDGANLLTRNMPITFLEDGPCWVNNHAHVYRFQKDALLGYIAVYIESISLEPWITGSAQPKLNGKIAREIPLPIPPITEQKKIVQVAESISKSVSEHQKQLESLQQLKAGLLQDLLTGKVRVSP